MSLGRALSYIGDTRWANGLLERNMMHLIWHLFRWFLEHLDLEDNYDPENPIGGTETWDPKG